MDPDEPRDQTTEIILDLLVQASTAHGVHEAEVLGGVFDADWPQWYAEYMTHDLASKGYQLVARES